MKTVRAITQNRSNTDRRSGGPAGGVQPEAATNAAASGSSNNRPGWADSCARIAAMASAVPDSPASGDDESDRVAV